MCNAFVVYVNKFISLRPRGNACHTIFFDIEFDRDTTAVLWVRMSAELALNVTFNDEEYLITVNGVKVPYDTVTIPTFGPYVLIGGDCTFPFKDYVGVTVQLEKGLNFVEFTTNNDTMQGGTLPATAPTIDCVKFDTTAKLSWTPQYQNLEKYFGENWWL